MVSVYVKKLKSKNNSQVTNHYVEFSSFLKSTNDVFASHCKIRIKIMLLHNYFEVLTLNHLYVILQVPSN